MLALLPTALSRSSHVEIYPHFSAWHFHIISTWSQLGNMFNSISRVLSDQNEGVYSATIWFFTLEYLWVWYLDVLIKSRTVNIRFIFTSVPPDDSMSKPKFVVGLKNLSINDGDQLQLSCNVVGDPEPQITWSKDGKVGQDVPNILIVCLPCVGLPWISGHYFFFFVRSLRNWQKQIAE